MNIEEYFRKLLKFFGQIAYGLGYLISSFSKGIKEGKIKGKRKHQEPTHYHGRYYHGIYRPYCPNEYEPIPESIIQEVKDHYDIDARFKDAFSGLDANDKRYKVKWL